MRAATKDAHPDARLRCSKPGLLLGCPAQSLNGGRPGEWPTRSVNAHGQASVGALSKILGERWREMSAEEKARRRRLAAMLVAGSGGFGWL